MLSGCANNNITNDKYNAENLPRAIVSHFETDIIAQIRKQPILFFFSNDQGISITFCNKKLFCGYSNCAKSRKYYKKINRLEKNWLWLPPGMKNIPMLFFLLVDLWTCPTSILLKKKVNC